MIKQKGFTLIEVLVALAIIGIGLIVVLQVFPLGFSVERNSQFETQATLAAQEKIESLMALSFPEVVIGTTTEDPLPIPFEDFLRVTRISFVDSNIEETDSPTALKKIEVIVSWKSPLKISNKEIKLITLFAEK